MRKCSERRWLDVWRLAAGGWYKVIEMAPRTRVRRGESRPLRARSNASPSLWSQARRAIEENLTSQLRRAVQADPPESSELSPRGEIS